MKKILIYLLALIVLGCSNEDPLTETLEKEIVTTITINESNITGPLTGIPSEPSTLNKSKFEVAIPFSLSTGVLGSTSVKKVTVNSIEYDVVKYECAQELHGSFRYDIQPVTLVIATLKENNNAVGVFYNAEIEKAISKKLSSDLLKTNGTIIYYQGSIDNSNVPFEVRLTFRLNATLEVAK